MRQKEGEGLVKEYGRRGIVRNRVAIRRYGEREGETVRGKKRNSDKEREKKGEIVCGGGGGATRDMSKNTIDRDKGRER